MKMFRSMVNSVVLVREKFSRLLTISDARKVCWVILSSSGASALVATHLLGQHLGVARNHGQRSIHLMRDAGGEQADGGELSACVSCVSSCMRLGDVVDQNDAADHGESSRNQRGDGDIGDAVSPVGSGAGICRGCACRVRASRGQIRP